MSSNRLTAGRDETIPAAVRLETCACPLCGASESDAVLSGVDRLHGLPGRFTIVRCRGCALMRTNPRPTPDTIGYYYPDDYGPYQYTRVEAGLPIATSPGWKAAIRRLMDTRAATLPALAPGTMLEVGCASGAFLAHMQREGWSVSGVEFSPTAAQAARDAGFDVFAGSLDHAPLQRGEYDLIVAWMVLEHLHDPIAALHRLRESITDAGLFAFSVPNAAAIDFRLFRDAGYAVQLPSHLFHFTPRTIARALEQTGWKIERLLHQRTVSNLVASLGYRIADFRPSSRVADALVAFPERGGRAHDVMFPLSWLLSAIGQTGRMTIWARPA